MLAKKRKALKIIVERIGCRLVTLGQSFSLFTKTGRDRHSGEKGTQWRKDTVEKDTVEKTTVEKRGEVDINPTRLLSFQSVTGQ